MGKPAARLADTTAHGGTIAGPGAPNVLIGKMPAATMGDMQICPMCNGPVPHVGGLISLGSTGVFIGKKPAARVSDMCVCVGPPSMPVVGHFQTLIGEVGGAGGGAQAALAATAQSAVTSPGSVKPMEVPEPTGTTTENHEIKIEIVDSAGLPLMLPYEIKDPVGAMLRGVTTVQGKVWQGGYAVAGGYELRLKALTQCRISASTLKPGDKVEIEVLVEGFTAEEVISFAVLWKTSQGEQLHGVLNAKVQGNKAKATYVLPLDCGQGEVTSGESGAVTSGYQVSDLWVMARSGQWITLSTKSKIETKATGELWCGKKALSDALARINLADGTSIECRSDTSGKFKFDKVPAGCFDLEVLLQGETVFKGHLPSGTAEPVRIKMHRQLTVKAVADKLIEIESKDGFASARDAVGWLDYRKLNAIAKIGHAKNDPHFMPSRFMLLQGVTDSGLSSKSHLDAWPLKLHQAAPHQVSIENSVAGLKHFGYFSVGPKPDASKGLVAAIYENLLDYLDKAQPKNREPNLKAWQHTVAAGDRLSEIAARYGEASWETVMAANKSALKDNPDLLVEGLVLSMPEREHPWVKWFEEEGYDPIHLGGGGYVYPWQYISLTLVDIEGQALAKNVFPLDVTISTQGTTQESTEPPLAKMTLQKAEDLFLMAPRSLPIEIHTRQATWVYQPPRNGSKNSTESETETEEDSTLSPNAFQANTVSLI